AREVPPALTLPACGGRAGGVHKAEMALARLAQTHACSPPPLFCLLIRRQRGYYGRGPAMADNSSETNDLLQRAGEGDAQKWGELLTRHDKRLRRMLALRLDQRLQGRIDPSDVLQEAYLEAWTRLAEYLRNPTMPFFLWLRFLAGQKLVTLHRHHL